MNRILVQFCCSLSNSVVSFGCRAILCVLILNWSNNRKYVLGKNRLCSSKKTGSGFGEKLVRFLENRFGCGEISHRYGEISHWLWKKTVPFLGKTGSVFGTNWLRFWEKNGSIWGEIGLVFGLAGDKAQVSLFWTLSMFGFGFRNLKVGVSKKKSTGSKLEG